MKYKISAYCTDEQICTKLLKREDEVLGTVSFGM
jgi:hypothetical protein